MTRFSGYRNKRNVLDAFFLLTLDCIVSIHILVFESCPANDLITNPLGTSIHRKFSPQASSCTRTQLNILSHRVGPGQDLLFTWMDTLESNPLQPCGYFDSFLSRMKKAGSKQRQRFVRLRLEPQWRFHLDRVGGHDPGMASYNPTSPQHRVRAIPS